MASVESRCVRHKTVNCEECPKSAKWQHRARWRDGERNSRRSQWFPRKHDADTVAATVEADLARGSYIDVSNKLTVAEQFRNWAAARPIRPATKSNYDNILRHIEITSLGARPLVKVKPSEVQAWVASRSQLLGPSTLRLYVGVLRSALGSAVLDGLIARNPVQPSNRLSMPKQEHNPVVPLTVAQVRQLADAMPPEYRATVTANAGLGLRPSELLALRVQDVNFLRREVRVEDQLDRRTRERADPKTPHSRRTVPLPSVVANALAKHMQAYPSGRDGLIFCHADDGRPIRHRSYADVFGGAVKRAGLPHTTPKGLRHHYASVLLPGSAACSHMSA